MNQKQAIFMVTLLVAFAISINARPQQEPDQTNFGPNASTSVNAYPTVTSNANTSPSVSAGANTNGNPTVNADVYAKVDNSFNTNSGENTINKPNIVEAVVSNPSNLNETKREIYREILKDQLENSEHNSEQQVYQSFGGFRPLVNVDKNDKKSAVAVHLPAIFNMHQTSTPNHSELNLNVLSGLVKVDRNKTLNANGELSGPTHVYVFGIPIYLGRG